MSNLIHPAYLWVGSGETLKKTLNLFLKKIFCKNFIGNSCSNKNCKECPKIDTNQHHNIRYLYPEKSQYTVSQLDIIFESIIYSLDAGEHFFFVIDKAELLNIACANKLLKSLEEPPQGYHFILLAKRTENILPTIVSRCVINNFGQENNLEFNVLFKHFTGESNFDQFALDLSQTKIPESEIVDFLDQIYNFWYSKLTLANNQDDLNLKNRAANIINLIDNLRKYPPMPGSSQIFLKNLYMQYSKTYLI